MSSIMKVDTIQKADGTDGVHIAGHVLQVVSTNLAAVSYTHLTLPTKA